MKNSKKLLHTLMNNQKGDEAGTKLLKIYQSIHTTRVGKYVTITSNLVDEPLQVGIDHSALDITEELGNSLADDILHTLRDLLADSDKARKDRQDMDEAIITTIVRNA